MANISTPNATAPLTRNGYAYVYVDCTAAALVLYEYVLTLPTECRHMWQAKKSLIFALFLGLRYLTVLDISLEAMSNFLPNKPTEGCTSALNLYSLSDFVQKMCIYGLFILRVYAMWDRNRFVLFGLTAVAIARLVFLAWTNFSDSTAADMEGSRRLATCNASTDPLHNQSLVLVFDTLVLLLTLTKTVQHVRGRSTPSLGQSLSYQLLRDGVLYFLSIEVWVIAGIVVTYLNVPEWTPTIFSETENILASIMAQRLVLNLRQVDEDLCVPTQESSLNGDLRFAHGSVLGNIGAPLRDLDEDAEDVRVLV